MATALLNKRLLEIERMRAANPQIKDPTPTLVDIERTHLLFMNAHKCLLWECIQKYMLVNFILATLANCGKPLRTLTIFLVRKPQGNLVKL